ncbi:YaaC family protein [Brucella sp. RRSP16]|uniref:YaaC family protein n=1 Tax=Brucella sp. RRSP16 TaxID=3453707 RepID=UPI003FCDF069
MPNVKYKGRELAPHKASINQIIGSRTVLTKSPWTFVALWLKREKKEAAAFYWEQAREFHRVSEGLPLQSAPLLLYYCYMNAAKALLAAKNLPFIERHGVGGYSRATPNQRKSIATEGVRILGAGVLPSLSSYYQEPEMSKTHTLQEIFFNLPFIHRTYCLSYPRQVQMFMPMLDPRFTFDAVTHRSFLRFRMSKDHQTRLTINRLAPTFVPDPAQPGFIRSANDIAVASASRPSAADLNNIAALRRTLSWNLFYINGAETLWYAKARAAGPARIERQVPTLVLAAMHHLSELCRYRPLQLASHLAGKYNWLLSEFIQMSPSQFIDEIAAELTGHEFQAPNVRSPS